MKRERFRTQFAIVCTIAVLSTVGASAMAIPALLTPMPEPKVQESVWCGMFGWGVWKWGLCPSWIPIPPKLQPILQPDVPTCDIYGPCQEAKRN